MYRLLTCVFLLFLGCTARQQPAQQVLALQHINELVTVEYVVNKIIKANDNQTWYKVGDRKILISCKATLRAGINFAEITAADYSIQDKTIELSLPPAKLFSINIKPEDVDLAYEEVGTLRHSFSAAEKNSLVVQGQQQIEQSAEALGILHTAEANATIFVTNFLEGLGFEEIKISFRKGEHPFIPLLKQ